MKYIYGPVKSRRLGLSLGISLTPYKVCSFDCVYCQLGRTTLKTGQIKEYVKEGEIIVELKAWLKDNPVQARQLKYVTFSGFGEPTLNLKFPELIKKIKKLTKVRVSVITNSAHLTSAAVRKGLSGADLIVPSLDAATQSAFEKIDRPLAKIKITEIINGLVKLRKSFRGLIWLEIMLVKGVNDSSQEINKLKEAVVRINPDKVQINSPVRLTADAGILPVSRPKLKKIQKIFGKKAEII